MPYYDFKKLNEISLYDVCKAYGIDLKETSTGYMGKVRGERTASFSISKSKNCWSDFGVGESGGTAISLVQFLEGGIDYKEASRILAEKFSIEPEGKNFNKDNKEQKGLTNAEYEKLGVFYENAIFNFDWDLEKLTDQNIKKINALLGMPMCELAEKNPKLHDKILVNKVLPKIKSDIKTFNLANEVQDKVKPLYECETEKDKEKAIVLIAMKCSSANSINEKIDLLEKGLQSNKYRYEDLRIKEESNVETSLMENLKNINKEISLSNKRDKEVGTIPYKELKKLPGKNRFISINANQLSALKKSDIKFSAFLKEENLINLIIKETDVTKVKEKIEKSKDENNINISVKENDLEKTLNKMNVKFEKQLGNINYSALKKTGELEYMLVPKNNNNMKLLNYLQKNIKICAFDKGDKLNIAFSKADKLKVEKLKESFKEINKSTIGREK